MTPMPPMPKQPSMGVPTPKVPVPGKTRVPKSPSRVQAPKVSGGKK